MRDINNINTMQVTRSLAMSGGAARGAMICIKGPAIGSMVPLENDRKIVVGRDPSHCNFVLADLRISRKHLEITYIDALKKYRVVDFSSNGTYLADKGRLKQNQEYYLDPSTELWLGGEEIRYKLR